MLDNEPENNDSNQSNNPGQTSDESGASRPTPRRRRAATRQAGPPSVTPESSVAPEGDGAAMTAEAPPARESAPPADQEPAGEHNAADEPAKPAKKATRKRATKTTDGAARTPRKRASKKAAAAEADGTAAESPTGDQSSSAQPDALTPDIEEPSVEEPTVEAQSRPAESDAAETATGEEPKFEGSTSDEVEVPEDAEKSPDAEAALDQIRLALSAELPPGEPTSETDEAEDDEPAADATDSEESDDDDEDGDESADEASADDEDGGEASAEGDDDGGANRRRRRRRGGRRRRRGGGGSDSDESRDRTQGQQGETDGRAQADATASSDAADDDAAEPDSGNEQQGNDRQRSSRQNSGRQDSGRQDSGRQDAGAEGSGRKTDESQPESTQGGDAQNGDSANTDDQGDEADDSGQRRRRRRRRRRGEDNGPAADDPAEVVVRVREPRSRKQAAQEVTGIEGSTRMEAKRQRRREGREAGRRRAPILSEAEFLARRESVVRKMVIRQREELTQIAVLEDDILVEHYVDRESAASLIGNVYLGRVQNVLPSMEAAFIDIGRGRNAVLYAGEVDWAAFGANGQQRKVENVLKSGQTVLVQVTKDPVGAKGARLTSHVTLPGRYIVYAPGGHLSGISRKLPDNERKRLKSILNDLVPESASVIVRTAAEGSSEDELTRDVNRLKAQWEDIERKVKQGSAPKLLYGEPDLTVRIVRDLFTEDFAELIIQGNGSQTDAYDAVDAYVEHVAPHLHDRMRRWDVEADGDLFAKFRLDEQISKALERKVFLPSGGSLIIDRTEAMTVIDVNTGKFTGSGGNLEATVTSNNLEAAEEIVRQLRLRDIGGIIVIDFIDMVLPSNRELLLRRLVECLGRDRTRHQVAEVTSLGLVQMTRKKIGTGLLEAFTTECEHCHGRGYEISDVPVETQKQPDGGSRDHRGGGGGGGRDRGRGRGHQSGSQGNQSGSGGTSQSGNAKPHHQPIPAALRPDHHAKTESTPAESTPAESTPAETAPAETAPAEQPVADQPSEQHGEQKHEQAEQGPQHESPETTPSEPTPAS